MPLIDAACQTCDTTKEVYCALSTYDHGYHPTCETCGAVMAQQFLPKAAQWRMDPIVVFRDPITNEYRYPGQANSRSSTNYERKGFERIELRDAQDVRRFESRVGKAEASKAARVFERRQEQREASEKENRSKLRDQMRHMSPFGRAVAHAAMRRNDAKVRKSNSDVGFHNAIFSNNRSNQD